MKPPTMKLPAVLGAVAQLGERLVCNQEATGSIPVSLHQNSGSRALGFCGQLRLDLLRANKPRV